MRRVFSLQLADGLYTATAMTLKTPTRKNPKPDIFVQVGAQRDPKLNMVQQIYACCITENEGEYTGYKPCGFDADMPVQCLRLLSQATAALFQALEEEFASGAK